MASLFPTGSATAYQRYATELSNAILYRDWIYDPDYALARRWADKCPGWHLTPDE